jgi:predicted transcriptional regulator
VRQDYMTLTLQLVENGRILVQIPLAPIDWSRDELVHDLDKFEANFTQYSKLFTALSNETRLMMMKQLIENKNHPINFTDFMRELNLNPKLVWENTKKLREGGLVVKVGRGRYRCSAFGETSFLMMSLAFRRLLQTLEKMDEE